jgi:hypothetical protein
MSFVVCPKAFFFDPVSLAAEEIEAVHKLEVQGKPTSPFPYVPHTMMRVIRFFTRRSRYTGEAH